jgi:hypothetical protein
MSEQKYLYLNGLAPLADRFQSLCDLVSSSSQIKYAYLNGLPTLKKYMNLNSQSFAVTPGFKGQSRVHLIYAPKKTTHIIT